MNNPAAAEKGQYLDSTQADSAKTRRTTGDSAAGGGKLVIVSGPSGVGKSTICHQVARRMDNVYLSVSATTRPKGPGEVEGRDYFFVTREQFEHGIAQGRFLEYAEVFGNLYGTPKDKVSRALSDGRTVILEIDVQGGKQVSRTYPESVSILLLPPDQRELVERLNKRARDSTRDRSGRLAKAAEEVASAGFYRYTVVNDDLEKAINRTMDIIREIPGGKK